MPANIYELQVALSKTSQTAIDVASTDLIRMLSTTEDVADLEPIVEDNSDEIGRGSEFPDETFLAAWKATKKWGCYASAESLAIAAAYGLGNGSAGTYTPQDPINNTNEIELPWMTVLEGIRKGGAKQVLNRAILGMVVEKFRLTVGKGPGKANSKLEMDLVGTGKYNDNSTLTMPDRLPTHLLRAASLTCVINGVDYKQARSFETFDFEWDNKVRDGYFPGSDFQITGDATSGAVQGRMEFGKRELKSSFVARFENGSPELTTLIAQTQGSAVFGLSGGTGFEATITMPQVTFKTAKIANEGGIVTVKCEMAALYDGNDLATLVSIVVNNTLGTVGRA